MRTPLLSEAFVVNVDAHSEECFFERIDAGVKFSMQYSVALTLILWHI